jgi:Na+-translocating ferredoxin:NAD+ oxidoreductase RnfE subunit
VVPLAVTLCVIIGAIAAEHAQERRPAWHTWLASLSIVAGVVATIAIFVAVGRQLPN